ncbi:hypothetical protein ROHU_007886 [Labeo rohita]|uniref:Uncharacterized protein n=1 Tax=Labeo rohita TaxID=84645 RepID=A0A498MAF5_LABRO|nr:hypothetical protein ROHU_007886 [Labeo rohita]
MAAIRLTMSHWVRDAIALAYEERGQASPLGVGPIQPVFRLPSPVLSNRLSSWSATSSATQLDLCSACDCMCVEWLSPVSCRGTTAYI